MAQYEHIGHRSCEQKKKTEITDKLRRQAVFASCFIIQTDHHHKELRLVSLGGGEPDTVEITILTKVQLEWRSKKAPV